MKGSSDDAARVRGVVFDMDGTVSVTEAKVHTASWRFALEELVSSIPAEPDVGHKKKEWMLDEIWKLSSGQPEPQAVDTMVEGLRTYFRISATPKVITGLRMTFLEENKVKVSPNPFIREIVEACCLAGIPTGICTSSRLNVSQWLLRRMGLKRYFPDKRIVTCDLLEASGHFKPSALPWALAFDRLGVFDTRETLLVLEDNLGAATGALEAHPGAEVYLLVPQETYQREYFQAQKVQPHEFRKRIQVVTSWKPVLDRIRFQLKYLSEHDGAGGKK